MSNGTDQNIGRLLQLGEEHSKQLDKLFRMMDDRFENGCAVGTANTTEIKKHEERIGRMEKAAIKVASALALAAGGPHIITKAIELLAP